MQLFYFLADAEYESAPETIGNNNTIKQSHKNNNKLSSELSLSQADDKILCKSVIYK